MPGRIVNVIAKATVMAEDEFGRIGQATLENNLGMIDDLEHDGLLLLDEYADIPRADGDLSGRCLLP